MAPDVREELLAHLDLQAPSLAAQAALAHLDGRKTDETLARDPIPVGRDRRDVRQPRRSELTLLPPRECPALGSHSDPKPGRFDGFRPLTRGTTRVRIRLQAKATVIGPLAVSPGEASPIWRLDQARYLRPRSVPGRPSLLGEERGADRSPQETCLAPGRAFRFRCPRCCRWTRLKVPNYGGVGGLGTGPCRAVGADPPCDTELGGDLACRRLGSQGKYVERVYARDPCQAGR